VGFNKIKLIRTAILVSASIPVLFVAWLFLPNIKPSPSSNISELGSIIKLSVSVQKVKWEIFETPENSDFVPPGPTDYVTLIAELQSTKGGSLSGGAGLNEAFWIPPEAARHWLSPKFKAMLENRSPSAPILQNCKVERFEVRKTGRIKDGLVCDDGELTLLIVTLYEYT
jgi:hypothetical protein